MSAEKNNRRGFTIYIYYAISALLVISALCVSLTVHVGGSDFAGSVPENSYSFYAAVSEEPDEVFVLYISGEPLCWAKDEAELRTALDIAAENSAEAAYGEIVSVVLDESVGIALACVPESVPCLDTATFEGISLPMVCTVSEKRTVVDEFKTVSHDNADLLSGEEKVITEGVNGVTEEMYEVSYRNGEIIGEKLVLTNVLTERRDKVVEKGVKLPESAEPTSLKMFIMPYDGGITSEYGPRKLLGGTYHYGVDIASKTPGKSVQGEPLMAAGDGTVVFAGTNGGYGKLTIIEHDNGIRTYYGHQSKITVSVGDRVKQGQIIGNIGSTGQVTGPHVHFEVRIPKNGEYVRVDPRTYIIDYESYYRD